MDYVVSKRCRMPYVGDRTRKLVHQWKISWSECPWWGKRTSIPAAGAAGSKAGRIAVCSDFGMMALHLAKHTQHPRGHRVRAGRHEEPTDSRLVGIKPPHPTNSRRRPAQSVAGVVGQAIVSEQAPRRGSSWISTAPTKSGAWRPPPERTPHVACGHARRESLCRLRVDKGAPCTCSCGTPRSGPRVQLETACTPGGTPPSRRPNDSGGSDGWFLASCPSDVEVDTLLETPIPPGKSASSHAYPGPVWMYRAVQPACHWRLGREFV